jgi:hypothetical protein
MESALPTLSSDDRKARLAPRPARQGGAIHRLKAQSARFLHSIASAPKRGAIENPIAARALFSDADIAFRHVAASVKDGGVMSGSQKINAINTFNPQLHTMHAMLVSRTASHLASAMRPEGRDEALVGGITEVIAHCGHAGLGLFLAAIWHWLDERDYHEAADAVQHYIESGTMPTVKATPKVVRRRDVRV